MASLPESNRTYESPLGQPEALWWFFEDAEGKEQGPMPFRELREKAVQRTLKEGMPVWREGDDQRHASQEIVGLLPSAPPPPKEDPGPKSSLDDENPYATPNAERSIAEGPPGGLYLPYLGRTHFSILLGFLTLSGGLGFLASSIPDPTTQSIVCAFAGVSLLGWLVFSMLYLCLLYTSPSPRD